MKKLLLGVCLLVCMSFVATQSFGGMSLVCDPLTDAQRYHVIIKDKQTNQNVVDNDTVPVDATGTYGFKYDLTALANGQFIASAAAYYTGWGWSDFSVPFDFAKPAIAAPANIRLMAE